MKKCLVFLIALLLLLSFCVAGQARTSASYGYLIEMYYDGATWFSRFDLLTVTHYSAYTSDIDSIYNESDQIHTYPLAKNCMLYSCDSGITTRCATPQVFFNHVGIGSLCYVFYLFDEVVMIVDAE